MTKLGTIEKEARRRYGSSVLGVDEVGRGCLAGPIFAAAVALSYRSIGQLKAENRHLIRDSKTLSREQRAKAASIVSKSSIIWAIGMSSAREIESLGLSRANFLAMKRAIALCPPPSAVLIDGKQTIPELNIPQIPIVKGDSKAYCIAAASIIAKVARDKHMEHLHKNEPHYGFDRNAGYGTKEHLLALKKHGPSLHHRKNFAPIKDFDVHI